MNIQGSSKLKGVSSSIKLFKLFVSFDTTIPNCIIFNRIVEITDKNDNIYSQ